MTVCKDFAGATNLSSVAFSYGGEEVFACSFEVFDVARSWGLRVEPIADLVDLFVRVYQELVDDGFFTEAFGYECVDAGFIQGQIRDVELDLLLTVHKKSLWPIAHYAAGYREDDLFDVIEYLFERVSKRKRPANPVFKMISR